MVSCAIIACSKAAILAGGAN